MTKKELHAEIRKKYMHIIEEALENHEEQVLVTASNEFAIPCVDADGNDEFIVITFKVPTGSRDGDAYDGFAVAEDFKMKQAEKAEKAKASAEAKAKKMARDAKARQQKAEAKAKRKNEAE